MKKKETISLFRLINQTSVTTHQWQFYARMIVVEQLEKDRFESNVATTVANCRIYRFSKQT